MFKMLCKLHGRHKLDHRPLRMPHANDMHEWLGQVQVIWNVNIFINFQISVSNQADSGVFHGTIF